MIVIEKNIKIIKLEGSPYHFEKRGEKDNTMLIHKKDSRNPIIIRKPTLNLDIKSQ